MALRTSTAAALTALIALGGTVLTTTAAHAADTSTPGVTSSTSTVTALHDREWRMRVPGVSPSVFNLAHLTITRNGQVTGGDGCNTVTARSTTDVATRTVHFTDVEWSQRACRFTAETGNAYVKAAAAMESLLSGDMHYVVGSSTASLTSAAGQTSVWTTTMPAQSTSLTNTIAGHDWHFSEDFISPEIANRAWFRIDGAGKLTGSDSCNNMLGEATVDVASGTIVFGPTLSTTRMLCSYEAEQDQLDAQYVTTTMHESLAGTSVSYINTGSRLLLVQADGNVLTFVR